MKFHFAITGHGNCSNEVEFVESLQNLMIEWNAKHRALDRYHVLVREDVIED